MESRIDATREALRSPFPWIAFAVAVALTLGIWLALERARLDDARHQFDRRAEGAAAALRARLLLYDQILRAGAAYVASKPDLTRQDWGKFIAFQQLAERFPGVQAVGFAQTRANGSVVVEHLEPAAGRNTALVGFDLASDPLRRTAIERARASGGSAITARMMLPSEGPSGEDPGFYMFVPAGRGYVFSPIRVEDLSQALVDQGVLRFIDLRIYDEPEEGRAQMELIDTRRAARAADGAARPMFERVMSFPMPGRSWTMRVVSRPDFDALLLAERPWLVAAGGILAGMVMFLLTTALIEAWNRARGLSLRDPLTGLFNRRYHDETMPRELARARRARQPVGVIAIDIDHFKKLNDTHGHPAGDEVLANVGELLRSGTRGSDIPCRFGGEEFAVILPGADIDGTRMRAEALRSTFEKMTFVHEGREIGPFTLSAGVACIGPDSQDWEATLRLADRALYAAKESGRNRVL